MALTLWQPWASLVVFGQKCLENRKWRPPQKMIGRRFAIHAGSFYDRGVPTRFLPDVDRLGELARIRGAVVGTAVLQFAVTTAQGLDPSLARWFFGPVGWVLTDVRRTAEPLPCRGYQKFWELPEEISRRLAA